MKTDHASFERVSSANASTATDRGRRESDGAVYLGLTLYTDGDLTPHCLEHGAMNRVSATEDFWRCLTCQIGGIWHRELVG